MGRSESVVWRYFDQVNNANASKYKKGRCKFCSQEYISNAQRMLNHLIFKCNECPESVKNFLNSEPISQNDTSNTNTNTNVIDDLTPKISTQMYVFKGVDKEKKIDHFFDKVTPQEQKDLEAAFARALIATNLPLSVFDNYYWKSFFTSLRPAFKKPSRYVISHRLLNAEYEKVNKAVEDKINNADTLTIMSDGWTDVNGDGFTNIVITTPEPIFYQAIESKEKAHTAKYICNILSSAIRAVGFNKVKGVVTDNTANMKLAWSLLRNEFPHLITYGCLGHGLNLLVKDILNVKIMINDVDQPKRDVLTAAKEIINFFQRHHQAKQILKRIGKENKNCVTLISSCPTRWQSHRASLNSLLKAKDSLQLAVMIQDVKKVMPEVIRRDIMGDIFWITVDNLCKLISPATALILCIEGDKPNLSYFPTRIKKLFNFLEANLFFYSTIDEEFLLGTFAERKDFLSHPVQLAAHVLNPKLKTDNLDEEDLEIAMDFINKHAKSLGLDTSKIANDIAQYIGKCSIWSSQEIWDAAKTLDPVTWWKGFCSMRELTKLAIIYLNFPCTSAACERNWKDFSNIKTKHRNLLTNTRTIKLVSVKYNLSLLAPDPSKNKKQFIEEEEFEPITLIDADDEDSDDEADDYGDCPSFDELF